MQYNFNARTVEPQRALDPIPAGWYIGIITESEGKATQAGGGLLELSLKVIDGPHTGRECWDRLNLKNANAIAEEIAHKQLSAICHATGVLDLQDTQQLHNIPLKFKVAIRPAEGQYGPQNEIKGYKGVNEQDAPGAAPAAMPWQQPGAGAAPTPAAFQPAPPAAAPAPGTWSPAGAAPIPAAAAPAGFGGPTPAPPTAGAAAVPWKRG